MYLLNYFMAEEAVQSEIYAKGGSDRIRFIKNHRLDMDLVLKKFGISAPAGTVIKINGKEIPLFTGVFELGMNQIDITSLEFLETVNVNIYYMF